MKKAQRALALPLLLFVFNGCAGPKPETGDLVGHWVAEAGALERLAKSYESFEGASPTLELSADGTLEARDFPQSRGFEAWPAYGRGTWHLKEEGARKVKLALEFNELEGSSRGLYTTLELSKRRGTLVARIFVGDPDSFHVVDYMHTP